jgi:hypothetical protein
MHQIPVYLVLEDDAWFQGLKTRIVPIKKVGTRNIRHVGTSCGQERGDGVPPSRRELLV